jgi:hypothetical protein
LYFLPNPILCLLPKSYTLGEEYRVHYQDCLYFGLEYDQEDDILMSKFVVSNEWQDKALSTGINFATTECQFQYIVKYINHYIQQHRKQYIPRAYPKLITLEEYQQGNSHIVYPLATIHVHVHEHEHETMEEEEDIVWIPSSMIVPLGGDIR